MFIKLTGAVDREEFWVPHGIVLGISKDAQNKLVTTVQTTLRTDKGLVCYQVLETQKEVATALNEAIITELQAQRGYHA